MPTPFLRYMALGLLLVLPSISLPALGQSTAPARTLPDPSTGAKPCSLEDLQRPFVLLTKERLEALRQEIANPGRKRDYYLRAVKANADRWLARAITVPERAGHYHHFVCTDGTRLEVPENQDFGKAASYKCPACGKWYVGEKFDGARRNYEHHWMMTAARDLALSARLENNSGYAQKAAEILRKYADAYPGRHTKPTEGGIYYQSLDESMFMIPLAQAYDLIYDQSVLSDQDKQHIERNLFWESAAGLIACGAKTNWGSWHLSAVGVIGLATKHQKLIGYATEKFQAQIRDELGDDGLWPESVHTYHFFPLGAFIAFAEASTNAGNDLWNWEAKPDKGLRAMFTAPLRYMYPDGRLPAINDGWFDSWLPADQYEAAYSRFQDPEMAWAISERRRGSGASAGAAVEDHLWSFVVGRELPDEPERPALSSTNFPILGICTLRTGNTSAPEAMLTFDYGRMLGHGQLDVMGITLHAGGRLLAADYGTPSYGTAILPFYKGTSSHNTIAVDGKNQSATKRAELLAFKDTPLVKLASARTHEALPHVDWRRTVFLTDEYALVVDDLASTAPRTYDWFFHAEGDRLDLPDAIRRGSGGRFNHEYISDIIAYGTSGTSYTAQWRSDKEWGLSLVSACPPGTEIFTGRCPAETGVRKVPILVQRARGETARFVAMLRYDGQAADQSEENAPSSTVVTQPTGEIVISNAAQYDVISVNGDKIIFKRSADGRTAENLIVDMEESQ